MFKLPHFFCDDIIWLIKKNCSLPYNNKFNPGLYINQKVISVFTFTLYERFFTT